MTTHCPAQRRTAHTALALPLPLCFSPDSTHRHLTPLLAPLRHQVHTALVPALLYVPARYLPLSPPHTLRNPVPELKRADSACAADRDSEPESRSTQLVPLDEEKPRAELESCPRGRAQWACDFCGLECFCGGLAG